MIPGSKANAGSHRPEHCYSDSAWKKKKRNTDQNSEGPQIHGNSGTHNGLIAVFQSYCY